MIQHEKSLTESFNNLPKIDLHRHLFGCFREETLYEIRKKTRSKGNIQGLLFEDESVKKDLYLKKPVSDLNEYLAKWKEVFGDIPRDSNTISRAIFEAGQDAIKENIKYLEFRISIIPGIPFSEILNGIKQGIERLKENNNILVKFLLSIEREKWSNIYENKISGVIDALLLETDKYKEKYIVGFDLSGNENIELTENLINVFKKIKETGYKITVHAGETPSYDLTELLKIIRDLSPDRIGHGIFSYKSEEIIKELLGKKLPLEICMTSNYLSGEVKELQSHPVWDLYKKGLNITVNTDSTTFNNKIDLNNEYKLLFLNDNFGISDLKKIIINSLNAAFCSKEEKEKLYESTFKFLN